MLSRFIKLILLSATLFSCASVKESPKYSLGNGSYLFKQKGQSYISAYVDADNDSMIIMDVATKERINPVYGETQYFLTRSFDVDIMTVPFKYRPTRGNLPRQLNTDFNGNVFIGYRFDRFKIKYNPAIGGLDKTYSHRGFTVGGFAGLGSTSMGPWTTNHRMSDEYSGLILSRGIAVMVGVNTLTVGIGVGWDSLTDRDKYIWIYQDKPWYGLTVGLNLN